MDLALNNLQRLICHKTQTNKQYISVVDIFRMIFQFNPFQVTLTLPKKIF